MRHCFPGWLVLLVGLALLAACGDDPVDEIRDEAGLFECDGDLTGEVSASDWVREHSEIDRYRYRIPADGGPPEFTLLSDDAAELGTLRLERVADEDRPVYLRAEFSTGERVALTAAIEEAISPADTYVMVAEVERPDDGRRFGLWAEFGQGICEADPVQDGLPACVGGLPLENPIFALPGCGLSREALENTPDALSRVTYYSPLGSRPVPVDGGAREGSAERFATLEVMARGRALPAETVQRWAEELEVDTLIRSAEHRRFVLAFLDRPWLDRPQEHANYCEAPDLVPSAGSFLCADVAQSRARQSLFGLNQCLANFGDITALPADNPVPFDFECKGAGCRGWVWGDPHFVTHDGAHFNFQGAGEYIMARSLEGAEWEVQARFEPIEGARELPICQNVTVTTAVATMLDGHRVVISIRDADELRVDGLPFDLRKGELELSDGYRLDPVAGGYRLAWPTGEWIQVGTGNAMSIDFVLPPERTGQVAGILGYFDGDETRDFMTRDGRILAGGLEYDALYLDFGASWRVPDAGASLFDYADGEGPDTFFIDGFPDPDIAEFELPPDEVSAAEETCAGEGITNPALFEACMLDFVCSSDPAMAADAAKVPEPTAVAEDGLMVVGDIRLAESFSDIPKTSTGPYCDAPMEALLVPERSGFVLTGSVSTERPASMVAGGETVDTYVLYRSPAQASLLEGDIHFGRRILGVQYSDASLARGTEMRVDDLDYPHTILGGIELDTADAISLWPDLQSVSVSFDGEGDVDYIRILVDGGAP